MNRVIITHGKPSREKFESPNYPGPVDANWLGWIAARLEVAGYETARPTVSAPYSPSYEAWNKVYDRLRVGRRDLLIGHSFGVANQLNYLSLHPELSVEGVIGIAPWFDPDHRYPAAGPPMIDPELAMRIGRVTILYSERDGEEVQRSVKALREALPASQLINVPHYRHFLHVDGDMPGPEFPELAELLKLQSN